MSLGFDLEHINRFLGLPPRFSQPKAPAPPSKPSYRLIKNSLQAHQSSVQQQENNCELSQSQTAAKPPGNSFVRWLEQTKEQLRREGFKNL